MTQPDEQNIRPIRPEVELAQRGRKAEVAQETRGGRVKRAKRRQRVLELRAAGLTEEQIGGQLGLSQGSVSRIINKALSDWAEKDAANVDQVRQMKLYELDQLKRAIWAKALQGDLGAVREATKIINSQAKIAGAEAPARVERHTTVDLNIDADEVGRMEQAWLNTNGGEVIEGVVASEMNE